MSQKNRERGIALISVLWVLLLLSGLAGAAALMARTEAILTHKLGELTQAEATTDAALVNAIVMLSDEKTSRHPPIDGQPQMWEFRGIPVAVAISNEDGRIDVNTADDDLVLAFLYSQGISEDRAAVMLRDLRNYQHATNGAAPAGTLRTIYELKRMPSWPAQAIDCWSESLTVYTGLPGVSGNHATAQVNAALQWAYVHHLGNPDSTGGGVTPAPAANQSLLGEVIRITATAAPKSDITASSEWIGRLTGDTHQPTLTMKWSRIAGVRNSSCKNNVK